MAAPTFGQRVVRIGLLGAIVGGVAGLLLGLLLGYSAGLNTQPFSIPIEIRRQSRSIAEAQKKLGVEYAIETGAALAVVGAVGGGGLAGLVAFAFAKRT